MFGRLAFVDLGGREPGHPSDLSMVHPETGELDTGFTVQSFREECDINTIVDRFGLTGQLPEVVQVPRSGDFTGVVDFQTAMDSVVKAREGFMELPAKVRARFRNDVQEFMEFMSDSDNRSEAVLLGLVKEPVAPAAPVLAIPAKG